MFFIEFPYIPLWIFIEGERFQTCGAFRDAAARRNQRWGSDAISE
jgi:hypothetical protein